MKCMLFLVFLLHFSPSQGQYGYPLVQIQACYARFFGGLFEKKAGADDAASATQVDTNATEVTAAAVSRYFRVKDALETKLMWCVWNKWINDNRQQPGLPDVVQQHMAKVTAGVEETMKCYRGDFTAIINVAGTTCTDLKNPLRLSMRYWFKLHCREWMAREAQSVADPRMFLPSCDEKDEDGF